MLTGKSLASSQMRKSASNLRYEVDHYVFDDDQPKQQTQETSKARVAVAAAAQVAYSD